MEEVAGSSDPSSHGRSHRVVPTGSTGSWLQPEPLSRAHSSIWVFATQDGWYLCKPSLPLFSVPTPWSFPSFPMCTEIGCASVLCGSVTGPLARLLSNALSWFLFTWATGTAVLGRGIEQSHLRGAHPPLKPRVLPGARRKHKQNPPK